MSKSTSDRLTGRKAARRAAIAAVALASATLLLGAKCSLFNKPPTVPIVTGPSAGVVGVPVAFEVAAADPDGDSVAYQFDWGDTSAAVWTAFFASGETTAVEHIFADSGAFAVRAKVKDANDKESDWSAPLTFQVGTVGFSWPDSLIGEIQLEYDTDLLVLSPDGSTLYAVHEEVDRLTPIRTLDRTPLQPCSVGPRPKRIVFTSNGQHAYISCVYDSVVAVLRTADNTVVANVHVGWQPYGVAISPDDERVYVALPHDNALAVISTLDNTVVDSIYLGDSPHYMTMGADDRTVYTTLTNVIGAVDVTQRTVADTVDAGLLPSELRLSVDGERLYVVNQTDSGVAVVRTSDFSVLAHVRMADRFVSDIALAPSGEYLLGSTWRGISCVALPACAVVDSTRLGKRGTMAFAPDGESLYVTDGDKILILSKRRHLER